MLTDGGRWLAPPPVGGLLGGLGKDSIGGGCRAPGGTISIYIYIYNHDCIHRTCPISTLRVWTEKNKMQPTNPNAHTYVNGTDVETHGYAVTQNTFLQ